MYIKVENLTKEYIVGDNKIIANNKLNFDIKKGEFVIILGPSGAGKSTFLNILGGMDKATYGNLYVDNLNITKLDEKGLTTYRRNDVGFVFQLYNLVPNLTVLENVELSSEIVKNHMNPEDSLKLVGLSHRKDNFPSQLSGGEQQRVSIARAICKNPKILLCDEPTGALDYSNSKKILKLLHDICKNQNTTVIVITHNNAVADMADKVVIISDSKINSIKINENPKNIDDIEW